MADLPAEVVAGAVYRMTVLVLVLVVGFSVRRRHHWPVAAAIVFGLASNVAFLYGNLSLSGLFAVPYIGLMGWVMIEFMRSAPTALRGLLGEKEAAWSKERHDLLNDLAAREAELFVLRARVDSASDDA